MPDSKDPVAAWEDLKASIPDNHAKAAELLWEAGDNLADEVERLRTENAKMRAAVQRFEAEISDLGL